MEERCSVLKEAENEMHGLSRQREWKGRWSSERSSTKEKETEEGRKRRRRGMHAALAHPPLPSYRL